MNPLIITLAALGALSALIWSFLLLRLAIKMRSVPVVRPASIDWSHADPPRVTCLVPAHNEERHIANTLQGILAQDYPHFDLIVIDDRSSDRTGSILDQLAAQDGRIHVIHGVERPPGWVGKTWALHQGVAAASASWLWFLDADMGLDPRALSHAMHIALRDEVDLVTFGPRAIAETLWQTAVGLALIQLLAHLYPVSAVNDPARPEAMAIGGFILVNRRAYEAAGGHAAVKSQIVEDIQLGQRIKSAGGKLKLLPAPDLVSTHLYGSLSQIWHGLKKNAYAGMDYKFHKFAFGALMALFLAWMPWLTLIGGLALGFSRGWSHGGVPLLLGTGLWAACAQTINAIPFAQRILRAPLFHAFLLPIGITLYVLIAAASVCDHLQGRIIWKGRVYDAYEVQSGSNPTS
jgi:glycosyltransferase involved in cell wall biosynthesis